MQDDVLNEIKSAVKTRMASPLLGSFAVTFFVTNWEFFYTLTRTTYIPDETIRNAQATLATNYGIFWAAPLLIAVAYTALYGWVMVPLHAFRRKADIFRQNWLESLTNKALRITTTDLESHPQHIELTSLTEDLNQTLKALWPHVMGPRGKNLGLETWRTTVPISNEECPMLLMRAFQSNELRQVHEPDCTQDVFCGVFRAGKHLVGGVQKGGCVPYKWGPKVLTLVFRGGRAVPVHVDEKVTGPRIEKHDKNWGIFKYD